jgi:hypothetical protein
MQGPFQTFYLTIFFFSQLGMPSSTIINWQVLVLTTGVNRSLDLTGSDWGLRKKTQR